MDNILKEFKKIDKEILIMGAIVIVLIVVYLNKTTNEGYENGLFKLGQNNYDGIDDLLVHKMDCSRNCCSNNSVNFDGLNLIELQKAMNEYTTVKDTGDYVQNNYRCIRGDGCPCINKTQYMGLSSRADNADKYPEEQIMSGLLLPNNNELNNDEQIINLK